ncbi:MAG: 30S ribosomal protein S3 [Proteobacteria bacterium]|nr:30S ribosomal protein S3 [Pseudomonadota bacterium]
MGQKTHPGGFRLGITRTWDSRWYSDKDFARLLHEDLKIRGYVKQRLYHAGISRVEIERAARKVKIRICTARPGIVIGKRGSEVDKLREELQAFTGDEIHIDIYEVRKPEMDAQLVAESVAAQIVRRVYFRRAMKKSVTSAIRLGAKGVKICCAGRLGGAEIARSEWYREGRVPLHTLRADIDFGMAEAQTTYGLIGVKVWVFKGERWLKDKPETEQ